MSLPLDEAKAPLTWRCGLSRPSRQLKWGLQQVKEGLEHTKKKSFKSNKTLQQTEQGSATSVLTIWYAKIHLLVSKSLYK